MPVNMMCERCGRSMGTVSFNNMRDWWQKHGEVCPSCVKIEADMVEYIGNMKKAYIEKLDKQKDWAISELSKWIKHNAEKRGEKTDG